MTPMERIEGELSDAQQRIAELEYLLARQAKAAQQGMDAAKAAAYAMEQNASRLYAECSPEALESECTANTRLTETVEELTEWLDSARNAVTAYKIERDAALEREQALSASLERIVNAWMYEDTGIHDNHGHGVMLPTARYRGVNQAIMDSRLKGVSLKRRDLIKQADELKRTHFELHCALGLNEKQLDWIASRENDLRQQAEALNE